MVLCVLWVLLPGVVRERRQSLKRGEYRATAYKWEAQAARRGSLDSGFSLGLDGKTDGWTIGG